MLLPMFTKKLYGFAFGFRHFKLNGASCWSCSSSGRQSLSTHSEHARYDDHDDGVEAVDKPESSCENQNLYPEMVPPPLERGLPAVKYERKNIADFVKLLPTIQEKIDYINPYERPWMQAERRRHRTIDPRLYPPRKAYFVSPAPTSYNLLPFYKFVTKTHTVSGLPKFYDAIDVEEEVQKFSDSFKDCLEEACEAEFGRNNNNFEEYPLNAVIDVMSELALQMFSAHTHHLRTAQVSRNARTECFWIRGGFQVLYDQEKWQDPNKRQRLRKQVADDRRIRGELAMYSKEKPALQIRTELPLPDMLGLWHTVDPLWMTPGFELDSGDPCEFGLLSISDCSKVFERCELQQCEQDEGEVEEGLLSMGILTAFNWLVGQAHSQGFNQYNDLEYPLVSQAILTNGRCFYFVTYQLNTLSMINYWQEDEKPCNVCWYDGPFDLFQLDSSKRIVEWDKGRNISKRFLKMLLNRPKTRNYEMKPYVDRTVSDFSSSENDTI